MADGKATDGFASTALVALLVRALALARPELLPPTLVAPDPMKSALIPAADKRGLVEYVFARAGAGPLLAIGQALDLAGDNPILHTLRCSATPTVLAEKWMRLERYQHASNRTRITVSAPRLSVERHAEHGQPVAAENALIAGLLTGLTARAGAIGVVLEIDGLALPAATLDAHADIAIASGARFAISWRDWPEETPGRPRDLEAPPPLDRLRQLLATDIGRAWRIGEAAPLVALSVRSLQRHLSDEGRSFSSVLRQVRTDAAGTLLADGSGSLAEIGYCCGYADQAHFQRDFRRALNMTPAEFRRIAHNG